ncbi:MAG: hypothetical protein AABZ55_01805, partial [Bdellovibrionota bacterium]
MNNRQPYGPLVNWAPGVWIRDGEWFGSPFRRRMTVIKLENGKIWIHNPFDLDSNDVEALRSLGTVSGVLAPNTIHSSDLSTFVSHFPNIQVFAPKTVARKVQGALDWNALPQLKDITWKPVLGTRIDELLLLHKPTRTLIATDLVFNMPENSFKGLEKTIMRWNGIDGQFGPSKIFKFLFVNNRNLFEKSIQETFEYDFDRILMNHGNPILSDGKRLWQE